MNWWKPNTLPYSWCRKSFTTQWYGTDTFESMMSSPNKADWKNVSVEYHFNSLGFRTHELDSLLGQSIDVSLGCSFTMGTGITADSSWPCQIEYTRSYPMLNLGIGGGSTDSVARILTNIGGLFNIQSVFILWPQWGRFEIYTDSQVDCVLPQSAKLHHIWNMDQSQAQNRFYKNQNIVRMLQKQYNFQLSELQLQDMLGTFPDQYARDGQHFGIIPNQILANKFLANLTQ